MTPRRPPFGLGAVLARLYALAGGISLVGAVGHHHPAEVLGGGAVVGSVDTLPDGDDADIPVDEVRLDPHALVEVAAEAVQPDHNDGVVRLDPAHELVPSGPRHQPASHHVGEDELLADAVVGQLAELGFEVPVVAVTLADPGVAVGYGDHRLSSRIAHCTLSQSPVHLPGLVAHVYPVPVSSALELDAHSWLGIVDQPRSMAARHSGEGRDHPLRGLPTLRLSPMRSRNAGCHAAFCVSWKRIVVTVPE